MEEKDLEQAKRRDRKVDITDIAIEKVPFIEYKGFTEKQNRIIHELSKEVLRLSQKNNDCNEVAITCALDYKEKDNFVYSVAYGDEHSVNVLADTESYHLIKGIENVTVIMMHNHPSTQTFSLKDLIFFLEYDKIKMMIVVSNQGVLHYLMREDNFNKSAFVNLYKQYVSKITDKADAKQCYNAVLGILHNCSLAGLLYR